MCGVEITIYSSYKGLDNYLLLFYWEKKIEV